MAVIRPGRVRLVVLLGVCGAIGVRSAPAAANPDAPIATEESAPSPGVSPALPEIHPVDSRGHGDDSTGERERARALFIQASTAAGNGNWQGALEAYWKAYRAYPHASTLYNVGYCYAELGAPALSWHRTVQALDDTRFAPDQRLSAERRRIAEAHRDALLSRLAAVTLDGARVDTVTVDGAPLVDSALTERGPFIIAGSSAPERDDSAPAATLATALPAGAVLYLDPGPHRLVFSSDAQARVVDLHLTAGERRTVHVEPTSGRPTAVPPPGAPSAAYPLPPPRNGASPKSQAPSPAPSGLGSAWRAGGFGALALGGLGFGTALVAGAVAVSADAELGDVCDADGACSAEHSDTVSRYQTAARWTNVGLIVGTVASAAGIGILVLAPSGAPRDVALRVTSHGLRVDGRF